MHVKTVEFIKSAAEFSQAPCDGRPHLAIAGRSNVGKSTLINYLLGRRSLARTSSKPGHTRLLNFFLVNDAFYLVDLPGFGYAAVNRQTQKQWGAMVHDYLENHSDLCSLLLLMDLRREPGVEEVQLMAWLGETGLPYFPVLTKIDKLKPQARAKKMALWSKQMREKEDFTGKLLPVSAHLKKGREELWARVEPLLTMADDENEDDLEEV
ncbi:MAG TPA: YihA family ribosome biogenesis GTP-binding protein [Desulfarculaceae bacterium]|nr:YihA family ribosome biogenesis GTP-binding protein [Desulfarculaceae bacterium]